MIHIGLARETWPDRARYYRQQYKKGAECYERCLLKPIRPHPLGRRVQAMALLVAAAALSTSVLSLTAHELARGGQPAAGPVAGSAPSPRVRWRPKVGLSWQWQLSVPVDMSVNVPVYDIDMFENGAAVVAQLHAQHRHVICYVDVGSVEDFRPDVNAFPSSIVGKPDGWPGERWLDIRQLPVLAPIMTARFDQCAAKGFDAVEPDLMDGFTNDTGFPITAADQLRYNRFIARLAHERGLAVGLKNDLLQVPELVSSFDFAVNEECAQYRECALAEPFIAAGKPVFHAEYALPTSVFCPITTALGFSSMRKRLVLDAWREPC